MKFNISKIGGHNYKIVTLTGEVINHGGALTGGSIQGKNTNLLGRKREIEELAQNILSAQSIFSAIIVLAKLYSITPLYLKD